MTLSEEHAACFFSRFDADGSGSIEENELVHTLQTNAAALALAVVMLATGAHAFAVMS